MPWPGLAGLLLSGACRQSKIINTPNFEKWLKKFVAPRHRVLPRAGPRRSRSNCVSLKSTPAPNVKSRVGESVYALMVFQTTRSIINIWRLGKCIRSRPSATAPRPAYALLLATRCDEKQCQDDALFHSMRRHAIGRGRKCRGGGRDLDLCAIVCSIEIMSFHAYAFPNRNSDAPPPCRVREARQ